MSIYTKLYQSCRRVVFHQSISRTSHASIHTPMVRDMSNKFESIQTKPVIMTSSRSIFNILSNSNTVETSKDTKTTKDPDGRIRHSISRIIPYPSDLMCEIAGDVARYKEFLPFCERSGVRSLNTFELKDAQSSPFPLPASIRKDKFPSTIRRFAGDLSIGFKAFTLTYSSTVTVQAPYCVISEAQQDSSKIFTHLISEWKFEPVNEGKCHVQFLVDFRVNNPLYAHVVNSVFSDIATKQLDAFTKRAQSMLPEYKRRKQNSPPAKESVPPTPVCAVNPPKSSYTGLSVELTNLGAYLYYERSHWSDADLNAFLKLSGKVLTGENRVFTESSSTLLSADLTNINTVIDKKTFVDLCSCLASTNATNSPLFLFSRYTECFGLQSIASHHNVADSVWNILTKRSGKQTITLPEFLVYLYLSTRANSHERIMYVLKSALNIPQGTPIIPTKMYSISKGELTAALHDHFESAILLLESVVPQLVMHKVRINQHPNEVVLPAVAIMKNILSITRNSVDEKCLGVCGLFAPVKGSSDLVLLSDLEWAFLWSQPEESSLLDTLTLHGFNSLVDWSIEEAKKDLANFNKI